jgi:hypothetical protein
MEQIKRNELYKIDLSIRTWIITIKTDTYTYHKFLVQGGERTVDTYAKELARDYRGTAKVKEVTLGK